MRRLLKKSIAIFVSMVMVFSMLPLTVFGAESFEPVAVGCLCFNESRWSNPTANIVNDGAANNFSMGYVKFDISSLREKHVESAVYTMISAATPMSGSTGLSVYSVGNSNMDAVGDNVGTVNTSHGAYTGVINAGSTGNQRIDLARTYYDLQKIVDFNTSQLSSGSRNNIDFTSQLNAAIDAGKAYFTLMIIQKGTNSRSSDSSPWSDTTITLNKSNAASISYVQAGKTSATLANSFYSCVCAGSNNRFDSTIQICNDGQANSFSYGLWQYDVSSLKSVLGGNLQNFSNASMTFNITGVNSPVGLDFYYATQNNGNLSSISTTNNPAGASVSGNENGGRQRSQNAINYYGGVLLKSFPSSISTGSKTIDVTSAVRYALDNDLQYVTLFALQPKADTTPGASTWTDINISKSAANITYKINGKAESPYKNVVKYVDPNRPADGVTNGQPFVIGVTGGANSSHFRIPGMVTLDDGSIVAVSDARWDTERDGGCNDTVVSISKDNGSTWNYSFVNYLGDNGNSFSTNSTGFCDSEIATDGKNIYLLTTVLPGGIGLNSGLSYPSNGAVLTDYGSFWLAVSTNGSVSAYNYTLGNFDEDGWAKIYHAVDSTGRKGDIASGTYSWNKTSFRYEDIIVDENYNIYNTTDGGKTYQYQSNLFFKITPFSVRRTSILMMRKSTDGGKTWEAPKPLPVKYSSEYFLGVGPGRGVVSDDGQFIAFAVYKGDISTTLGISSYNGGSERTSVIYSADGGKTWSRTADMQDNSTSEAQLVMLDDNTIRCFFRSDYPTVIYKDLIRNGNTLTWKTGGTTDVTGCGKTRKCQISAIKYSKKINGKTVLFVSTPSLDGTSRQNGVIYTVFLNDDYTVASTKRYQVNTGQFWYSCLTELADGRIADLIEDSDRPTYKVFSVYDLCGAYPDASGDSTDPATVQQDSFSSVYDSSHTYSNPMNISNALYVYSESNRTDSVITGSFSHDSTYLALNGTNGAFGSRSNTAINIRPTNLGAGFENTFFVYDTSNRYVHFDVTNKKYYRCTTNNENQNHSMYIYKATGADGSGGIKGMQRVSSLSEITDGDQIMFVHPDCDYANVGNNTSYYCIFPAISSDPGNHNGKIGNNAIDNTPGSVDAATKSSIEAKLNHGAYTGDATRAADNSYTTSSLTGGDQLSGALWVGGLTNHWSTSDDSNYAKFGLQYSSGTFLYDGVNELAMPITFFIYRTSSAGRNYNQKPHSLASQTSGIELRHIWHGCNAGQSGYVSSTTYGVNIVASHTVSNPKAKDLSGVGTNDYYANTLYIANKGNNLSFSNNMYEFSTQTWKCFYADNNKSDSSGFENTVTCNNDSQRIRILNYKPIRDAMPDIKSFYESNVKGKESYYTSDSLREYYNAITAVYFDPNSYFNTADMNGNGYSGCRDAINSAISRIDTAKGKNLVRRQVKLSFTNKFGTKNYFYNAGDSIKVPENSSNTIETISNDDEHIVVSYCWDNLGENAVAAGDTAYYEVVKQRTPQAHDLSSVYTDADGDANGYTDLSCSICEYRATKYDTQDWSTYDSKLAELGKETKITKKYSATSINNCRNSIISTVAKVDKDDETKSQGFIDNMVDELYDAEKLLELLSYTVDFYVCNSDIDSVELVSSRRENYGTMLDFVLPEKYQGYTVEKWVRTNTDASDGKLATNNEAISHVIDGSIYSYCVHVTNGEGGELNTVTASMQNRTGKICGISYVPNNTTVTVSIGDEIIVIGDAELTVPSCPFYEIIGYTINGKKVENNQELEVKSALVIKPIYRAIANYTITLGDNVETPKGEKGPLTCNWDDFVSVTAQGATENTAWYMDEKLVGFGSTYSFRVSQSCTITCVNGATPVPCVAVNHLSYNEYREKTITAVGNYYLPEGYTYVDSGVVLLTTSDPAKVDNLKSATYLTTNKSGVINASNIVAKTDQFVINVYASKEYTSFYVGSKAFLIYEDAQGHQTTIYSDLAFFGNANVVYNS